MIGYHFMRSPKSKFSPNIIQKFAKIGSLIILVAIWFIPSGWMSYDQSSYSTVWGDKPVVSYFVLTASWRNELKSETGLTSADWQIVDYIARQESDQLKDLYQSSQKIVYMENLNFFSKRMLIWLSGYNWQVKKILHETDRSLMEHLDSDVYYRLRYWFESHWSEEKAERGLVHSNSFARSYEIYATRYDAGGAYTVALPDKCLKFANIGNHVCDDNGYAVGQNYTVFLSYKKSTAATVLEAGPWNVDDNYWSGWADPQPRRKFSDLALGMPEAQAAFFNGYNGGLDQYGRKVTAPFGIDLSFEVSNDIGLAKNVNDWITVSFMWTESWGSDYPNNNSIDQPANIIEAVQTATIDSSGRIIHEVKFGQTLWAIADAYQVDIQEIYNLNSLLEDAVIIPGQKIIIKPALLSQTPHHIEITSTQKRSTATKPATSGASKTPNVTSVVESGISSVEVPANENQKVDIPNPSSSYKFRNSLPVIIIGLMVIGSVLLLLGSLLRRQI